MHPENDLGSCFDLISIAVFRDIGEAWVDLIFLFQW